MDKSATTKRCTKCQVEKPLTEFRPTGGGRAGYRARCQACLAADARSYNAEHSPEVQRRYREANPEKVRERKRAWYAANRETEIARDRRRREAAGEAHGERNRQYRDGVRTAVFTHYGAVCACPGCGATQDLTIDHVDGDGKQHREALFGRQNANGTARFYLWLIKQGFPSGFQTLCARCNSSKRTGHACRLSH